MVFSTIGAGLSDDQLIDLVLDGQEQAFNQLVHKYQGRIYNYAFYLLHSPDEAQDVTQETFIRAYMNLSKFRREASLITWLYRIAANTAYQAMRKLVKHRRIKEKAVQEQPRDPANTVTPEDHFRTSEAQRHLLGALDKLRPKHKQVLILKELQGLDVLEVAKICGVPEGTIKSRLNRARLELRRQLVRGAGKGGGQS